MAMPYWEKQEYIKTLFEYEERNNVPENRRLTHDAYADIPEIPDVSPRKKAYVDIRDIVHRVNELKYMGLI